MTQLEILRTGLKGIDNAVRQKGQVEPREVIALTQAMMILIDYLEAKEAAEAE